jgi:hypothetical protein
VVGDSEDAVVSEETVEADAAEDRVQGETTEGEAAAGASKVEEVEAEGEVVANPSRSSRKTCGTQRVGLIITFLATPEAKI